MQAVDDKPLVVRKRIGAEIEYTMPQKISAKEQRKQNLANRDR